MCNYHNMGTRTKLNSALNADEPVQQEQKRLVTWGTDIPDDLVLDKKLLEESLKKVSVTPCNFILLEFVYCSLYMPLVFVSCRRPQGRKRREMKGRGNTT
jgi:hypothetical protein